MFVFLHSHYMERFYNRAQHHLKENLYIHHYQDYFFKPGDVLLIDEATIGQVAEDFLKQQRHYVFSGSIEAVCPNNVYKYQSVEAIVEKIMGSATPIALVTGDVPYEQLLQFVDELATHHEDCAVLDLNLGDAESIDMFQYINSSAIEKSQLSRQIRGRVNAFTTLQDLMMPPVSWVLFLIDDVARHKPVFLLDAPLKNELAYKCLEKVHKIFYLTEKAEGNRLLSALKTLKPALKLEVIEWIGKVQWLENYREAGHLWQ
ncbi:hypothetical protein ACR6HW_01275 [Fusibacter sp. JL298sf-3]